MKLMVMIKYSSLYVVVLCLSLGNSIEAATNKVLIIGIDGCRPDALLSADTPNIDALWKTGSFSFHARTDAIARSGPCWTSMLTGVWSEEHGVLNNKYEVPSKFPHFFHYLKQQNPELVTASLVQWAPIHKILDPADADISLTAKPDGALADAVIQTLETRNPDLLFTAFDDVDHAGHEHGYGPHVSEYVGSIEQADEQVGEILAALRARPAYGSENWLIILSTDHGGLLKDHGKNHPTSPQENLVFLIVNKPGGELTVRPSTVDIPVIAMEHLGIESDPERKLEGRNVFGN